MSATILCQGCGGRVAIPDDYTRARIRCPECGVMSDVPAAAQKRPAGPEKPRRPAPPAETGAAVEDILLGDEPDPAAEEKPARRKAVQAIQAKRPREPQPLHPPPASPNLEATDADDGRPYRVPSLDDERPCPECRKAIARDAGFCTFCGYNLQTGKKSRQEFEPVQRDWQGGWPAKVRLGLFLGAEAVFLTLVVISIVGAEVPIFGAFFPWLVFTAMIAFLLGTYDRIHLTRNKKGRVRITKTWTICFLPRPPYEVDVLEYGGVTYGPMEETSYLEVFILIMLFVSGIIPGILWFYFVFVRTTFQVALTKQHGHDELVLYRGSNQKMVVDVAETIRDVAHLPPSQSEQPMTTSLLVRGACPHDCPDTCGVITEVRDGRAVAFRGDPDHPTTRGWLCAKVRPYLDHVYHPDRLLHPLRRSGPKGSGQWRRITWDEAVGEIASRWQAIVAGSGAEAILPYSYSGTLGLVQNAVAAARLFNRLGASQLQRSICGAAAERAVEATLGKRWSAPYEEVIHSRLVILWGHNPVSTAPHFLPLLRDARRRGCEVVVIDPRRTKSAEGADWHLAPIPGSDGYLAMGVAHILVSEARHDEEWLGAHAAGWPQLRERLADFTPARVAAKTGLAGDDVVKLARLYADTRPGLIKIADGINRNRNGGQNVRAVCTLPALTGQYGVRGGGLAYSTSGYLLWSGRAVNHWEGCPRPGRVVNMNRLGAALLGEVADPPIQSLYVFNANPVTSSPNAGRIIEGLRRDDLFTVVHELFLTDTADYADIVLPATSQLEHTDLHKAYGTTLLAYNAPAIAPLGECKSNWEVMGLLAAALGFREPWLHQSADAVIEEVLTATAAHNPALRGVTLARLKAEGSVPLAVDEVPFAGGRFPTPDGKVRLLCEGLGEGVDPLPGRFRDDEDDGGAFADPALALRLVSPASHHFVSSSLASQPGLLKNAGEPFVEVHPDDAAARGIDDGDEVIVENGRGWFRVRARLTDAVRRGVVVSPKGRWGKLSGGHNVNRTTSDALGDLAGQSTFHSNCVWVRRNGECPQEAS